MRASDRSGPASRLLLYREFIGKLVTVVYNGGVDSKGVSEKAVTGICREITEDGVLIVVHSGPTLVTWPAIVRIKIPSDGGTG